MNTIKTVGVPAEFAERVVVRWRPFRYQPGVASGRAPGPFVWAPALRDAVLDALADDDWRAEAKSAGGRGSSTAREILALRVARETGIEVDLPTVGSVIASLGEGEIRRRRAERRLARRAGRWSHLGEFAVDYARIRASRSRARRRIEAAKGGV